MSELKKPAALQFRHNNSDRFVAGYKKDEMDKYLSDVDEVIAELKADYDEVRGRLQTANLIKDEQLAAARHHKFKRCQAMAKWCNSRMVYYINSCDRYDISYVNKKTRHFYEWKYKWLELAKKFKEAK